MPRLTYLCSPYASPDPEVRKLRFDTVNRVAGILIAHGLMIFSPLSHSMPIAAADPGVPRGFWFWRDFDLHIINLSKEVIVLTLDGWRESEGVTAEIKYARDVGIPVKFVDENGDFLEGVPK